MEISNPTILITNTVDYKPMAQVINIESQPSVEEMRCYMIANQSSKELWESFRNAYKTYLGGSKVAKHVSAMILQNDPQFVCNLYDNIAVSYMDMFKIYHDVNRHNNYRFHDHAETKIVISKKNPEVNENPEKYLRPVTASEVPRMDGISKSSDDPF